MFQHLLVPLDGSRLAEAVLGPTRVLATRWGASVTLFHVLEKNPPATIHGEPHLRTAGEANAYLQKLARALTLDGIPVSMHVHDVAEADVARSITQHAAEYQSDLIVLATHGQGGMRDRIIGTIAQQVIGCGPTPVLILHPDTLPGEFSVGKIAVPWDLKESHESGVHLAKEVARSLEAEALLLTVVPRRADLTGTTAGAVGRLLPNAMAAILEHRQGEAAELLDQLVQAMAADGVAASARVERGEPAATIVKALQQAEVDLVILATHTKKGWSAFWAGSVAPRILAQWRHPILLVRARPV